MCDKETVIKLYNRLIYCSLMRKERLWKCLDKQYLYINMTSPTVNVNSLLVPVIENTNLYIFHYQIKQLQELHFLHVDIYLF